ncbi:hypothetical protein [uncultured Aquitalea sp.]|uniref:hypothetical protein n=1 Tax=uncultured Aquitalea sp. TaxID=540272 RepID=UPI0025F24C8F|nr:hypothetical protein [uncultured Aquitalea sp.]
MPTFRLPAIILLCVCAVSHAEEKVRTATLSLAGNAYQTASGQAGKLQLNLNLRHDTAYGSLFIQDGEAGIAFPAPAGWVSLGLANEAQWPLGGPTGHMMSVLRYGVDLPDDGSISLGWADRVGKGRPGQLWVMNAEISLGHYAGQRFSLQGWASRGDGQRSVSMGYQPADSGGRLEQANLLLMMRHIIDSRWSLDVGAGSRWQADVNQNHTSGWQLVSLLNYKLW